MPYCPDCAVEVDETVELCPLCGTVVQAQAVEPKTLYPHMIDPPVKVILPWAELRARIFAVLTSVCMIPLLIVCLVDLLDGRMTWSRFVMIPLASIWLYSGLGLYKIFKPVQLLLGVLAVTTGLLFGLDLCANGVSWFATLAGPAILAWGMWTGPYVWLLSHKKLGWANGAGWCLAGIAFFCLVLDMLISYHTTQAFVPSWSLIVVICLLPVVFFLLYVHHRVRKHVNLSKWFHV